MHLRPGIAIDLGTVNTLVHVAGRGIVVDEPSVVAVSRGSRKAVAVGTEAESFSEKEPEGIKIVWPLRDGVITDMDATILMLNAFLHRVHVHRGLMLVRPLVVMCVPRGATSIERLAVESTVESLSPHCVVRLVEEPVAASAGAGSASNGRAPAFVVDVGGGTTEVAATAGGRVVRARSLRLAGNAMDDAVARAIRATFAVAVARRAAERLKIELGLTGGPTGSATVVGVDLTRGVLRSQEVPADVVAAALEHAVTAIVDAVMDVLSEIPPGLSEDVVRGGIQLAGGGALLLGLARRIEDATGVEVRVVEDPLRCVVRGAAAILQGRSDLRAPRSPDVPRVTTAAA